MATTRASSEIRALSRDLRALAPKARKQAGDAVAKTVADTKRDYQAGVRVDTGNLRSSATGTTTRTKDGAVGEVGPTAEYGIYEELGTSTMSGNGALGRAFDRNQIALRRALLGIGELP